MSWCFLRLADLRRYLSIKIFLQCVRVVFFAMFRIVVVQDEQVNLED